MPHRPANPHTANQRQIEACARTVLGRVMLGIKIPASERAAAEAEIASVTALLERLTSEAQARAKQP